MIMTHKAKYHLGKRGKYCRQRLEEPSEFHKKSLRTIKSGEHKVVVGCPKKKKFVGGRCAGGTRAQAILHPLKEGKCKR